jgi:hypothetical protein
MRTAAASLRTGRDSSLDDHAGVESHETNPQIAQLRAEIFEELAGAVTNPVVPVGSQHLEMYMNATTDEALEQGKMFTDAEKVKGLEEFRDRFVRDELIGVAQRLGTEVASTLERARKDILDPATHAKLLAQLGGIKNRADYPTAIAELKSFIAALPTILKKWRGINEERERWLRHPAAPALEKGDVEDIAVFRDFEAFRELPYRERKRLVAEVAAVLRYGKEGTILFQEASEVLEPLEGVLIPSASRWLHRLFAQWPGSAPRIRQFLRTTLPHRLIPQWRVARQGLDDLCDRATTIGAPPELTPQSVYAFLSLHWAERMAYVRNHGAKLDAWETLQNREAKMFEGDAKEIDAALASASWGRAEWLLARADRSTDERRDAMEKLDRQLTHGKHTAKQQKEQPQKEVEETRQAAVQSIETMESASAKRLLNACLQRGTREERRKCTTSAMQGMGNMLWSEDHHHLDSEKLHNLRSRAEEDTRAVRRHGHRAHGVENIDVGTTEKDGREEHGTYRPYEDGVVGATYYHFNASTIDRMLPDLQTRGENFLHNYWVNLAPADASLAQIRRMRSEVYPKIHAFLNAEDRVSRGKRSQNQEEKTAGETIAGGPMHP